MKYILSAINFLLSLSALCQPSSVFIRDAEIRERACADTYYHLPVTVSGTFEAGNVFNVEVRRANGHQPVAVIPAVHSGNFMIFKFEDASKYEQPYVQVRVVSTAPKVESDWTIYGISVFSKGEVTLSTASFSDTINIYDDYKIRFTGKSTSDVKITLTDSSKYVIPVFTGEFSLLQNLVVSGNETYRIAYATNECGLMQSGGQVSPVINSTSLRTLSADPQVICEGSEVKVRFSGSLPLDAGTSYRVRFSDVNSNDMRPNSAEVPARLENGYLIARFPESFNVRTRQEFVAQVVTRNPGLLGTVTPVTFIVWPKPSAVFGSASRTIELGQLADIDVNFLGLPPFRMELSDGSEGWNDTPGPSSVKLRPDRTTVYTIKSLSTGCLNTTETIDSRIEIKVNPGIRFADDGIKQVFCAGNKARVGFVTNADLTPDTRFRIEGVSEYNGEMVSFPATLVNGALEFTAPDRPEGYDAFGFRIVTDNPRYESPLTRWVIIQTTPDVRVSEHTILHYEKPSPARLSYTLKGGAPYVLETMEGEKLNLEGNGEHLYSFFLDKDRDFRFRSVSNGCFANENLKSVSYKIVQTGQPSLSLFPLPETICHTDSIEVNFVVSGNFDPDNRFIIQGFETCCNFQALHTVDKPGKYKLKLAAGHFSSYASIRVSSTSPVLFSNAQSFKIQFLPEEVTILPENTRENPHILLPEMREASLGILAKNGVPEKVEYLDNGVEKTYVNTQTSVTYFDVVPEQNKVNEYVIRSVSNICGRVPVDKTAYLAAFTYRITLPILSYAPTYCTGQEITVPFGVTYDLPDHVRFSLQFAVENTPNFSTIATVENEKVITAVIPHDMPTGSYVLRIVSSDGVVSGIQSFHVGSVPTATLGDGTDIELKINTPWEVRTLPLHLTGGAFWTVVFSNGAKYSYYQSESTVDINSVKGNEYSIRSVYNNCGFGSAKGAVKVSVAPYIEIAHQVLDACEGGTMPVTYQVLGDADLSDDYLRFELTDTRNRTFVVLDSTRVLSGTKSLAIPEGLTPSQYELKLNIRKYNLDKSLPVGYKLRPGAVLSGNTTINSGESALLLIQSTKDNNGSSEIQLSDGTTSLFSGPADSYSHIEVRPEVTTTYTIASVSNSCGTGQGAGAATVEVNPPSSHTVTVTGIYKGPFFSACAGDEITVFYKTTGTFSGTNRMTVQISESDGKNFKDLPSTGTASPLKAVLPAGLVPGMSYRVRVAASDAGVSSGAFYDVLAVTQKAGARFEKERLFHEPAATATALKVLLEGGAPLTFSYTVNGVVNVVETRELVYSINVPKTSDRQTFQLVDISNGCGPGIIDAPAIATVEVVTGLEGDSMQLTFGPNPSADFINLTFAQPSGYVIEVFDLAGRPLFKAADNLSEYALDIRKFSAGVYVLRVTQGLTAVSYRIVKR